MIQQEGIFSDAFSPEVSLLLFSMVVIGGLVGGGGLGFDVISGFAKYSDYGEGAALMADGKTRVLGYTRQLGARPGNGEDRPEVKERLIGGLATFPVVGDPDDVVRTFQRLNEAGIDGMAFGLVNYIDELPLVRDEVLPRLERLGLRAPRH